ncbi:hypothetical protein EC957_009004 [Mortierella hygrophila]|uniref:Uncharacterized protein n=1 Tax=Mortierella hygrophila TaxID=979708 RepID=A0A9P6FCM7_9FUNG|nr:hypothetical protein EC957_009004 [Mortierella hygrophila]
MTIAPSSRSSYHSAPSSSSSSTADTTETFSAHWKKLRVDSQSAAEIPHVFFDIEHPSSTHKVVSACHRSGPSAESSTAHSANSPPTELDLVIAALLLTVVKQDEEDDDDNKDDGEEDDGEEDDGLQYGYSCWTPTNRRLHQGKDI